VLKLPRTQISGGDVPLVGGRAAVDRVVLVNYIDGFTLDGEFDMDSASTVICLQRRVVFTVLVILFLHTTFPGPRHTYLNREPSPPSLFCAERSKYWKLSASWMASRIDLRHVSLGCRWCPSVLPRNCSLQHESVFAVDIAT
jgi:hypothetical protein